MQSPSHPPGRDTSLEPISVSRDKSPLHSSLVGNAWSQGIRDLHDRLRQLVEMGQAFDVAVIEIDDSTDWAGRARSSDAPYVKQAITEHLNSILGQGEEIYRVDESRLFLIRTHALEKAEERCRKFLDCVRLPIVPRPGRRIIPEAACGLFRVESSCSPEAIIDRATTALLAAREEGVGRIVQYCGVVDRFSQLREMVTDDLPRALHSGQISINLQPIVCLKTGAVVGGEAFPTWSHPILGPIASADFLGTARTLGLAAALDRQVVHQAITFLRHVSGAEHGLPIWVNLSEEFLNESYLPERVRDWCHSAGITPLLLGFEIPESLALKDEESFRALLTDLSEVGIRLGIDGFGQSRIPMSAMLGLRLSSVKCKMSWLRERFDQPTVKAALASLVHVGHGLGCSVGATNVELDSDLTWLREARFDYAQGFGCIRPLSLDKFESVVRERNAGVPKISPLSI